MVVDAVAVDGNNQWNLSNNSEIKIHLKQSDAADEQLKGRIRFLQSRHCRQRHRVLSSRSSSGSFIVPYVHLLLK